MKEHQKLRRASTGSAVERPAPVSEDLPWSVSARLLDDAFGYEVRDFLQDHGVAFEERRACGLIELTVRCTEHDALGLANALALLGTGALFRDEGSCLLIVRPDTQATAINCREE